jgi:hypothetical protein
MRISNYCDSVFVVCEGLSTEDTTSSPDEMTASAPASSISAIRHPLGAWTTLCTARQAGRPWLTDPTALATSTYPLATKHGVYRNRE